jgi:hypothetical protein
MSLVAKLTIWLTALAAVVFMGMAAKEKILLFMAPSFPKL